MTIKGTVDGIGRAVLKAVVDQGIVVRLYTNPVDFSENEFSFEEPNDTNYAPIPAGSAWNDFDENGELHHKGTLFKFKNIGQQIVGWFLTNEDDQFLGAAARPEGPYVTRVTGDEVLVQPFLVSKK